MEDLNKEADKIDDKDQGVSPAQQEPEKPVKGKEGAKNVSKRINEVKKETEEKVKLELANARGYESYDEMIQDERKKTLEENGLEPEQALEVFNKLKSIDPEFQDLKNFKSAQEKLAQELFIKNQLKDVNDSLDTDFKDVKDLKLSRNVIEMFENGNITLEQAVRLDRPDLVEKKYTKTYKQTGKDHLQHLGGSNANAGKEVYVNDDELKVAKAWFGGNMTKDELEKALKQ